MIAIEIKTERFEADMRRIVRTLRNPRGLMLAVGREAANRLRRHFREKDKNEPNKLGGKREHFWLRVQRSVQAPVTSASGETVTISINHPAFAQKVFGGIIRAKRVRNLAIPVSAEAYGRAPAVFEHETGIELFFVRTRGGGVLAQRIADRGFQTEYFLTPSVDQDPDATALPEEEEFSSALVARAASVLGRALARGHQGEGTQ